MRLVRGSTLLCLVALAGCMGASQPVEVRIASDAYEVGSVHSALATPAVDEVIRAKAERVLIVACPTTPPRKIIQFETELRARHTGSLSMVRDDRACART